ncbi:hypothetical protein [Kaistia terrae]|uniref:Uncharacterized protein n=1 Tax=Kaistia terrae TaxID=537017 RepID=A0ABW0Q8G0_9HYPH|nr:hypothetical protein [Kaistia terrae]MCX5581583.1 hypothetical protein [Kaistia terrae]
MSTYTLRIADSFSAASIPLARLAEYMTELAKLLGETQHVHLDDVAEGSVLLRAEVDLPAAPAVRRRVIAVRDGIGADEAMRAFSRLDDLLAHDNAVGQLLDGDGAEIIPFPGKTRPIPLSYGPFREEGTLEGEVVRIGGKDSTIHIQLRDGEKVYSGCATTKEIARRLAPHMLGPTVRLYGTGTWERLGDGTWELRSFRVSDFEVLEDVSLADAIAKLRAIPGNEWPSLPNPVETLLDERGSSTH